MTARSARIPGDPVGWRVPELGMFIAVFAHHLWAMTAALGNPITDAHAFRQTQTAISAYWFLHGGDWWRYETPVLGPPWAIPFEFPLYQWVVAALVGITGLQMDLAGRLVSESFFLMTLAPCWMVLRGLDIPRDRRWVFLALLVASPFYQFWSRTFMIESTALFFGFAYVAALLQYLERPTSWRAGAAIVFGVIASTVKLTTFAGFAALAVIVTLTGIRRTIGTRFTRGQYAVGLAVLAAPVAAALAWTKYTDMLKALNPMADGFITSGALPLWVFGTWSQRFAADTWLGMYHVKAWDLLGHRWVLLVALAALALAPRYWKACAVSVTLFAATLLLFVNLHIVHDYYAYANGVFMVAAVGFGVIGLLDAGGWRRWAGYLVLNGTLATAIAGYHTVKRPVQTASATSPGASSLAHTVRAFTRPDDVLIIYGDSWSSTLPYYLERRAIMDRGGADPINHPLQTLGPLDPYGREIQGALRELGDVHRVGALLACNGTQANEPLVHALRDVFALADAAVSAIDGCDVYFRATIQK